MVKSKVTQNQQRKAMKRMKKNIVIHYVEAVEEITMQMSFGLAVTSVSGGSMESV